MVKGQEFSLNKSMHNLIVFSSCKIEKNRFFVIIIIAARNIAIFRYQFSIWSEILVASFRRLIFAVEAAKFVSYYII